MGDPVECEHANPENGDTLQLTTTGLSFYRKSTNTPTFTNSLEHWAITDQGLIGWTDTSIDPPGLAPSGPAPAPAPAPTATPAPAPPPQPEPGDILYQTNWSGGPSGWALPAEWKLVGGMLVNAGTAESTILASHEPTTPDYAVEAEIQLLDYAGPSGFLGRSGEVSVY
jgi:hypothetical protein